MSTESIDKQTMTSLESSISVFVRIRPFTSVERAKMESAEAQLRKYHNDNKENQTFNRLLDVKPIRKVVEPVDDRMLIFDPPYTNPLQSLENSVYIKKELSTTTRRKKTNVGNHSNRKKEHRYVFDRLFDEDVIQEEVYSHSGRPLLDSFLDGYNSTIFAYGATGCGKTYTISGTPESPGIIFLTMKDLFERMDSMKDSYTVELSLTYLEIYNEKLRDLLVEEGSDNKNLVIRENEHKKVSVVNISVHRPQSVEEVMDLIVQGNNRRFVCATDANESSSRSHAVLQIDILKKPKTAALDEEHVTSTLSIIDLAGSERASVTRNKGMRLHEGANINKSLLALGNCINALCDPRKRNHVPYRDSNLTRLLKFSLGGNCKTIMIACVSPSSSHYDETLNTLKYANRAKEIKTKVSRNKHTLSRHVMSYMSTINEQKLEIENLKKNTNRITQMQIKRFENNRSVCSKRLVSAIEELDKAVENHHEIKMGKAYVLANRKFLLVQKLNYEQLLKEFQDRFGVSMAGGDDLDGLNSSLAGFNTFFTTITNFLENVTSQIQLYEQQYMSPTDIDYIFTKTSVHVLQSLEQLETWNESDSDIYRMHVKLLRDSVERFIIFNSSIIFERMSIQIQDSFVLLMQFMSRSFELLLGINSKDDIILENLPNALDEMLAQFNEYLMKLTREGFKLPVVSQFDTTRDVKEDDSILASPYYPIRDSLYEETHQEQSTPVPDKVFYNIVPQKRSSSSPLNRTFLKRQSPSLDKARRLLTLTRSESESADSKPKKKVTWASLTETNDLEDFGNESSINEAFRNGMSLSTSFDTATEMREVLCTGGIDTDEEHTSSPLPTKFVPVSTMDEEKDSTLTKDPIQTLKIGAFPATSVQTESLNKLKLNPFANRFQVGSLTKGKAANSVVEPPTPARDIFFDVQPLPIKQLSNKVDDISASNVSRVEEIDLESEVK